MYGGKLGPVGERLSHGEPDPSDAGAAPGVDLEQLEADAAADGLGEAGMGKADAA